jgi:hypothetical protein
MGTFPVHQKESIALFLTTFGRFFRVGQYFEVQKPYLELFEGSAQYNLMKLVRLESSRETESIPTTFGAFKKL